MLERYFKLAAHHTTLRREIIAGLSTFLTMSYIIFVNPAMLSETGMDAGSVFAATCLASALACFIMGFYANYPIALAPGMGLNAFFTYTVVLESGYSWQTALAAVFISGVIFVFLSVFKIRSWLIQTIPDPLKFGIAAGIGFFLAIIGLKNAGIIVASPATLVTLGDLSSFPALMTFISLACIMALHARRLHSAIIVSILVVTVISLIFGEATYAGIVSLPPSLSPTFLQMDFSQLSEVGMISIIFAFLFVDLFDTSGTLVAVAHQGKLLDNQGNLPRVERALLADSVATVAGAALGTSTTTSYIESTSGVMAGGRTGLTAVVVGVLFLVALFFAPLASMIPSFATAGALIFLAMLMSRSLAELNWSDISDVIPTMTVALIMPLSFSIANGLLFGFIVFVATKFLMKRKEDISTGSLIVAGICLALLFLQH